MSERWDEVVVGAGSAGSVLAARLSERGDRRVLLIEAGVDPTATRGLPAELGAAGRPVLSGYNWNYTTRLGGPDGREFPYPVGKGLGGSSAVNGAIALRGLPADFDRWAANGCPEWSWEQVRTHFRDVESDGVAAGPVPIRRQPAGSLNNVATAFVRACADRGLPAVSDFNDGPSIGVGVIPSNAVGAHRVSAMDSYLARARERPNLVVCPDTMVSRVLLTGNRAVGVEVVRAGRVHRILAGRVTLSAGAVNSPLILHRSGVGDPHRLATVGITPTVALPGVGMNLVDHSAVVLWAAPTPGSCRAGDPWHEVMARMATPGADPDLIMFLLNNVETAHMPVVAGLLGDRMAVAVSAMLLTPASAGSVFVRDADPGSAPRIVLRPASDPFDVERLMVGARFAWSLLSTSPMAECVERVYAWTARMVDDDALLRQAVTRFATPTWHPVGSARMGADDDPCAVLDQHCRVRGLDGLRVVDASAMPAIPSAPPNLTCIVLAERVAQWMD